MTAEIVFIDEGCALAYSKRLPNSLLVVCSCCCGMKTGLEMNLEDRIEEGIENSRRAGKWQNVQWLKKYRRTYERHRFEWN